ncbi:MAG TPA: YihY/virulence factor BrkB family protein [Gemmatimonadaceae bacterium]|nr:YihY/virulence factor BrkB family protein [Gemmatimonadaceae bacterium]
MPVRPRLVRFGWALRDYAKRVWDNSGQNNVLFLAGGVAFNILLAVVPFFLLVVTGVSTLLDQSPTSVSRMITAFMGDLLPHEAAEIERTMQGILVDIASARASVGFYSVIAFIWFSTRLFGSLRAVLGATFDIEHERGIIEGKLFDIKMTVVSTVLIVAYTVLSAYLAIATTRGVGLLVGLGIRQDTMGWVEYWAGRLVGFGVIVLMFYSLYKFLPIRRVRNSTALVAAMFAGVLMELAKNIFGGAATSFSPSSFYTGTIAAIVLVVVWTYYVALIFTIGGEVGQVYELRRNRRRQREILYE